MIDDLHYAYSPHMSVHPRENTYMPEHKKSTLLNLVRLGRRQTDSAKWSSPLDHRSVWRCAPRNAAVRGRRRRRRRFRLATGSPGSSGHCRVCTYLSTCLTHRSRLCSREIRRISLTFGSYCRFAK